MSLSTPVVLIIFNRPDLTELVVGAIANARPRKLFVIADGPRDARDTELCQKARAVIKDVDWECELHTNFSEANLGCKVRIASGLDWVFEQVDEAIVLEDDCLPHLSFFRFCEELLTLYRDDSRVMTISGSKFHTGASQSAYSYHFSNHNLTWGWATWKRAWRYFDVEMKLWPEVRDDFKSKDMLLDESALRYWRNEYDQTYAGKLQAWDYPWALACWTQNGLCIMPKCNLVSNIGFRADATHTSEVNPKVADLPLEAMEFPLSHPNWIFRNPKSDLANMRAIAPWAWEERGLYAWLRRNFAAFLPRPVRRGISRLKARFAEA